MSFKIRPYHPSDLSMLYRICLKTGNSGGDASDLYTDPDLVGQFFAAPYAVLEPDLCFVVVHDGKPCGYIVGTRDSARFYQRCEAEWFPLLRLRYPLPPAADVSRDARIIRLIHQGQRVNPDCTRYPAHLHIDLLPEAQGQGMGRRLIQTFTDKLRQLGVPAVHLGVGKSNTGAVKFYERVGFHRIKELEKAIIFGMHLK
ncbi:GNAT family N-acetyltransferase [bacterium]|nr:GNAT family N-acetyltransferase [bacterium]